MRDPSVLLDAVGRAVPDVRAYCATVERRRRDADGALRGALGMDRPALEAALDAAGRDRVGARPTDEHEPGRIVVPHPNPPTDRDDARTLAERVLTAVSATFVDGSQVPVDADLDVPFGLVTISGSHARPSSPLRTWERAEAVTPGELDEWRERGVWNPDHVVNLRRWSLEMECLVGCMEEAPGTVAVYDGSLVHSFATGLAPNLRAAYAEVRNEALEVSRRTRSPLVGYTDTSRSRDLVEMLASLAPLDAGGLTDSALLAPHLQGLGDRTAAWWCDRRDGSLDDHDGRLAFHYALLGPGGPCRVEYPDWVLEESLHHAVHDLLLAQGLAFGGYPRSIDECHVKCSVTPDDAAAARAAFLRLAQEQGLTVLGSWKARSKQRGVRI